MTWKEFKNRVEALGVKDEDELDLIDLHFPVDAIAAWRSPKGRQICIWED